MYQIWGCIRWVTHHRLHPMCRHSLLQSLHHPITANSFQPVHRVRYQSIIRCYGCHSIFASIVSILEPGDWQSGSIVAGSASFIYLNHLLADRKATAFTTYHLLNSLPLQLEGKTRKASQLSVAECTSTERELSCRIRLNTTTAASRPVENHLSLPLSLKQMTASLNERG